MSGFNIATIVEGHGENEAVRLLLQNLTYFLGFEQCNVLKPIRRTRGKLLKDGDPDLANAINIALLKLEDAGGGLVLILVDAEDDCKTMGHLGPLLLKLAQAVRSDADIACVIANIMYETWFVASAESLIEYFEIDDKNMIPSDPEKARVGKGWIKKRIKTASYSETVDQPKLTSKIDFSLCRSRSKSFDKLCRELEGRMHAP